MSTNLINNYVDAMTGKSARRSTLPDLRLAAFLIWIVVSLGLLWLILGSFSPQKGDYLYLIPWCIFLGLILTAPLIYLGLVKEFDLFHPVVFPVWSYFFPGFVIGGFMLALGFSQAHYLSYIQDEPYNLPLTFVYVMVGFTSLVFGFATPIGRRIGSYLSSWLPDFRLSDKAAWRGGWVLLLLGTLTVSSSYISGTLGFQRPEEGSDLDGLMFLSTLFWYQATFLLALTAFRSRELGISAYITFGILVLAAITNALLVGSRGGFFHFLLPLLFAYVHSGREIRFRQYTVIGGIVAAALLVGIIYGTTFRSIRGDAQAVSFDRYVAVVPNTFDKILEQDPLTVLGDSLSTLASRLELVSSLAVVVSNHEALAPYEAELGISNNVMVETFTFFIPRAIWSEKPISIEPAKYADLYFNYSDNAFSMTPIGDLLRNFGPWGIPVGMFILGFILRLVYSGLIEGQEFSYWRVTFYYLLLTCISYDGTFGAIVPTMFKTAVIAIIGFLVVWLITIRFRPVS